METYFFKKIYEGFLIKSVFFITFYSELTLTFLTILY